MATSSSSSASTPSTTPATTITSTTTSSSSSTSSSSLAAGLARKLKKVLDTRTDSPELLAALGSLSSFYSDNSLPARRALRGTIERRGLAINEEFLQASEAAQEALDVVEAEVRGLAECCDRISSALVCCSSSTAGMVAATDSLRVHLSSSQRRQEMVQAFLNTYQLTEKEVSALRDDDVGESFFAALKRVQDIHSNCKLLLRTHHQRAGLELMDLMAVYQEGAYERMCRWVQSACRLLSSASDCDASEVSPVLRMAARGLRERPVLFKYCKEEVANTRHNALFRRFISALTRGGPNGTPRPIEVHAHDPLRYTGDMLAWMHQALASERELASALFGDDPLGGNRGEGGEGGGREGGGAADSRNGAAAGEDGSSGAGPTAAAAAAAIDSDVSLVLDRVFQGVCRPFKVRVDQVLTAQPGLVLAYKLSSLLSFYGHTISSLLGPSAALSLVLRDLGESAGRSFLDAVKLRGDKALRYVTNATTDLSPPAAVSECVALLLELLDAHATMMVPAEAAKPDFLPIAAALLDPVLELCNRAAQSITLKFALSLASSNARRSTSAAITAAAAAAAAPAAAADSSSLGRRALLPSGAAAAAGSSISITGRRSSDASGDMDPVEATAVSVVRHAFLTNCLASLHQPLAPIPALLPCTHSLAGTVSEHVGGMVQMEVATILDACQLTTKLRLIAEQARLLEQQQQQQQQQQHQGDAAPPPPPLTPLAHLPDTSPAAVSESLRRLFALLAGAEGRLPEFELLSVPKLRAQASALVAGALADAYSTVHEAVSEPRNMYADPRAMLRHTPEAMRTILGI